jgi:hypothetical protein
MTTCLMLCYVKALTQTMKGTKQIEDTKGGERKLKQCNSQKFPLYKCRPASFYRDEQTFAFRK